MESIYKHNRGGETRGSLIFILVSLLLAAFLVSGCSNGSKNDDSSRQDSVQTVVPVRVDLIKKETLDVTIPAYGVTSAQQLYEVISPVTGVITKFDFYNGDRVIKGEAIASIITKESYAAIKGAETMLDNAVTDEQKKEAERTIKIAEQSSNQIKIIAPFTGTLVNRTKNENEVVNEGEQIAGLINKNSIYFIAQVPSGSISEIKIGQPVRIMFPSIRQTVFAGIVKRIAPGVNMESQTFPVQIEFSSPAQLLADSLYGEATVIVGQHRDVFVVPIKAVIHDEEKDTYSITVINPDSIAYTINVHPGIKKDSLEEIHGADLKEGMKVIIEGNYGLPDSTKVSIKK
jgi:multidrug efflux pump subunit AcrA (membrane-fusion protein)